jgi:hypothetical protein
MRRLYTILFLFVLAALTAACEVPGPGVAPQPPVEPAPAPETVAASEVPSETASAAPSATDPVWESSEQWGMWTDGDYILYNNIWGSGAGTQTIWANSFSNWGVHADHPNTGGVKSYPNATRSVNQPLSGLNSLSSTFDVTVPAAGAYTSTYDIWADDHSYEVMLWMNQFGPVGPIGSVQQTVTVGGHSWDVYRGTNGSFEVFSFLRDGNTDAGTVDILAIMNWIQEQGWFGDVTVGDVQFGYEITSSGGGMDFVTNDFSVDFE